MTKTLLTIVQDILELMDSDEVDSISDTIEGDQIAKCIQLIYDQILTEYDLPQKSNVFGADATDDATNGLTRLILPSDKITLTTIRYDVRSAAGDAPSFVDIPLISNEEFLRRTTNLDSSDSNKTEQTWPTGIVKFVIINDQRPHYATLVEQKWIVFDAYDSDLDANILITKSILEGMGQTELSIADTTIIDLPGELLHLLEINAAELAFDIYKGGTPNKIRDLARKARVRQQRSKHKTRDNNNTGPNFGRKGKGKGTARSGASTGTTTSLPSWWT